MIHLPILLLSPGVKKKKNKPWWIFESSSISKEYTYTFSMLRKLQKLNYLQQKKKIYKKKQKCNLANFSLFKITKIVYE